MTTKRPFVRRNGNASDSYISSSGTQTTFELPVSTLGESLSSESRAELLEAVREGDSIATRALRAESSPELLEALLAGLRENIAAPATLLQYISDPRVAPALVSSASSYALGTGSNHFQVVAMIGGPAARAALRARAQLLSHEERCWVDDPFFNSLAGELATVAAGLLKLEADDLEAADCLVRLASHPCEFNRATALRLAADAYDFGLRTEAMLRLRSLFAAFDLNGSQREFTAALPVLMMLRQEETMTQCRARLFDEKGKERQHLAESLTALPLYSPALALLAEWIPSEPDPQVVLPLAIRLRSAFTATFVENLFRRALASESPSLRWGAIKLLPSLPVSEQMKLAAEALLDEVDPALASKLTVIAGAAS